MYLRSGLKQLVLAVMSATLTVVRESEEKRTALHWHRRCQCLSPVQTFLSLLILKVELVTRGDHLRWMNCLLSLLSQRKLPIRDVKQWSELKKERRCWHFAFCNLFLAYSHSFNLHVLTDVSSLEREMKIEKFSSGVHVVHTNLKHVISRRCYDKRTCKACNTTSLHS